MLIAYIQNAMRLAKYEILEDGQYYGEIEGCQGVWAQADQLETCRDELQSALEDWLVLGLRMGINSLLWEEFNFCQQRRNICHRSAHASGATR